MIQELLNMSDDDFRAIVDQDLRSDKSASERTTALRDKAIIPRWLSVLQAMLVSIEGQLATGEADFEAMQMALQLGSGNVQEQLLSTGQRYYEKRARQLRFKSGVDAMLIQARYLQSRFAPEIALVTKERNQLVIRVHELETAIYKHRSDVLTHDQAGPLVYDQELWKQLPVEILE